MAMIKKGIHRGLPAGEPRNLEAACSNHALGTFLFFFFWFFSYSDWNKVCSRLYIAAESRNKTVMLVIVTKNTNGKTGFCVGEVFRRVGPDAQTYWQCKAVIEGRIVPFSIGTGRNELAVGRNSASQYVKQYEAYEREISKRRISARVGLDREAYVGCKSVVDGGIRTFSIGAGKDEIVVDKRNAGAYVRLYRTFAVNQSSRWESRATLAETAFA